MWRRTLSKAISTVHPTKIDQNAVKTTAFDALYRTHGKGHDVEGLVRRTVVQKIENAVLVTQTSPLPNPTALYLTTAGFFAQWPTRILERKMKVTLSTRSHRPIYQVICGASSAWGDGQARVLEMHQLRSRNETRFEDGETKPPSVAAML